jgi:NADPH-dependent 2,4-dienoyl-CoA reductase/sulfur reductase-like enzyme
MNAAHCLFHPRNPHLARCPLRTSRVPGAGFGGLTFCRKFSHPTARVTLVDRTNDHLFQPLLYQVATPGLGAQEIARPVRSILKDRPNVTLLPRCVYSLPACKRGGPITAVSEASVNRRAPE